MAVYDFVNLPIGTYTLTFTHDGFETQKIPSITVQADRTATVNAVLPVGQVGTVVEVQAEPLMNAVDTTNGYVLDEEQIQAVPLPTGSFTGLAILSPGVNAELPRRHRRQQRPGQSADLGQWPARYQQQLPAQRRRRQQLFNGKSTSQVASARIVNNTGVANPASTTPRPSRAPRPSISPLARRCQRPRRKPFRKLRVNTSMYDAQQGRPAARTST
jgi:hypothetical protein